MKAKQRTLLVLIVFVILAGAALFFLTEQQKKTEQATSEEAEGSIQLAAVSSDDLEQIQITYGEETLTLNYADGSWTLAEDPEYHLDTTACNTMLTALSDFRAKRQLTAETGEDYGFDAPQITVSVTTADAEDTFVFGAENSVTGDLYLKKQGEDVIYTVAGTKASCFEQTKADLFGAFNPAGLTSSSIEAIELSYPDGRTFSFAAVSEPVSTDESESDSEDDSDSTTYQTVWRDTTDPDAELTDSTMQSLLSALSCYVTGRLTDTDPAAYHVKTLVTAKVTTSDGEHTLTYGEGTDGYYLTFDGDDSLYSIDGSVIEAFKGL